MLIKVKTLTGREIEISVESTDTVAETKKRVEQKAGIPPPQQRLIFAGKAIELENERQRARATGQDDKKLSDFKLEGGSTIHLVLALRGGVAC